MRAAITIAIILAALAVAWAVLAGGKKEPAIEPRRPVAQETAPAHPGTSVTQATPAADEVALPPATATSLAEDPSVPATVSAIAGLRPRPFTEARVPILGSNVPAAGYKMEVDLSAWGASIMRIQLTDFSRTVMGDDPYVVLDAASPDKSHRVFPMAARTIWINGQPVSLGDVRWELIEPRDFRLTTQRRPEDARRTIAARAVYALTIVDGDDQPVVELRRTYRLERESYHLSLAQEIINKTDQPLQVIWEQRAQADIQEDESAYGGDHRMFAAGYFSPQHDPHRAHVLTASTWLSRYNVMEEGKGRQGGQLVWPKTKLEGVTELVWLANMNRYFALVTHSPVRGGEKPVPLEKIFPTLGAEVFGMPGDIRHDRRILALTLASAPVAIAPGSAATLDLELYAGPRQRRIFALPPNDLLQFHQLIKYEFGCTWCTFQPLAKGLLLFLTAIETIVRDWGVAIIILVLVVRLILHPITKKSQVNMMKMGKQMASLQPELEKLKKKYADDQQKFQQEQMRLFREKGVNPLGMLGCLPMLLQTPIWIALYATLFFAIELRHQPAFYGVFQMFNGWGFLADLSSPDRFIRFSDQPWTIKWGLLESLDFSSLNILPLLWAVVMFFQQKYTTPPPANEQAAQQQKIMKWMTLLFPFFLYSAPSGLTLYILASSAAGIVDSYYVRKHIREEEARGPVEKKPRKPGGLMDRLAKALQEKQREMMELQQKQPQQQKKKK